MIHPPLAGCDGLNCKESCHYRKLARMPEYRRAWGLPPTIPGPGTELKAKLAAYGFPPCQQCSDRAAQMDLWGVDGCLDNRDTIIGWLEEKARQQGWGVRVVNWLLQPIPDLVDESIRLAAAHRPTPEVYPGLPDPLVALYGEAGKERVVAALGKLAVATLPAPTVTAPRGVVYVGGGRYWPMIVVALRMLRAYSDLPVQVWYRGEQEPVKPEEVSDLPGVTFHDATQIPHRKLGGWEAKGVALMHCGFEQVLYLDADAYVTSDPAPLFDHLSRAPFVFWQDLPDHDTAVRWAAYDIPEAQGQAVPAIQGGQLVLDRVRFWRELTLFHWLNQHSDYNYQFGYGDQDQYRVALALTGSPWHNLGRAPWKHPAFVCGPVIHRCQGKWWGNASDQPAWDLPGEAQAWFYHERQRGLPEGDAGTVFGHIYRTGAWGYGDKSGGGSTPNEAQPYWNIVNPKLSGVTVDLACGDGLVTRGLQGEVVGVDVYEPHIENLRRVEPGKMWVVGDIDRDRESLPCGDTALLKDVLMHWPNELITDWLRWAVRCGKWKRLIVTVDYPNATSGDVPLGSYRALNWMDPPLNEFSWKPVGRYLHKDVLELQCLPTTDNTSSSGRSCGTGSCSRNSCRGTNCRKGSQDGSTTL